MTLSSEIAGKVEQLFSDIGQPIPDKGEFACLDKTFIKLDIQYNTAEQAGHRVDIDYFSKQVDRYKKLVKLKNSAQQQLENAEREFFSAQNQLAVTQVQAKILAERKRRYCIAAPKGWLTKERLIEPGQWINKGEPIAKLGDFSRLLIPFALSMEEYQVLRSNKDDIRIRLPDLDTIVPARIERISPAFDEQSRKIMLELEISSGPAQYRGGLRAELTLSLSDKSGAILAPISALKQQYEQYWLKKPDGEQIRVVYLGKTSSGYAKVVSPAIKAGDQFLINTE